MENSSVDKKNDYNNEPVYFCASCLSLSVMNYTGMVIMIDMYHHYLEIFMEISDLVSIYLKKKLENK